VIVPAVSVVVPAMAVIVPTGSVILVVRLRAVVCVPAIESVRVPVIVAVLAPCGTHASRTCGLVRRPVTAQAAATAGLTR
jgi:hypothetical protein